MAQMICEHCGQVGEAVTKKPGSTAVSVVLLVAALLAFMAIGILAVPILLGWVVYGLWRLMTTQKVCPSCEHAKAMVSLDSPRGKQLQRAFSADAPAA
jgi:hypothetical protein